MGFLLFFGLEFVLFIIFSLIDIKNRYLRAFGVFAMFFLMFAFSALRGSGDADYYNYLWFAKDIGTDLSKVFDFSYPVEFSFRFASLIVNLLGASRQWVIALMNLLSVGSVGFVVYKKSRMPFLSAIIFLPVFLQFDTQTSRTATAIGLGLLSTYFMVEKRTVFSLISLALALSFHRSAIIIIPFLFYLKIDLNNIIKSLIVGFSIIVSVFSKYVFALLSNILRAIGMGRMASKVVSYTFEGKFAYAMKLYDPRIVFALLLFIMSIMYFNKDSFNKYSMDSASVKAVFYGLVVVLIFRSSTAIAFRFSSYFTLIQAFFIPLVIEKLRGKDDLAVFLLILSILIFIIPYAAYIALDAPAYDFFFTNPMAINSLS